MSLERLIDECEGSVYLEIDSHIVNGESLEDWLDTEIVDVPEDIYDAIIEHDSYVLLRVYPRTGIDSFSLLHYDLNMAIDEALVAIGAERLH
jgi:hypothetical protein